MFFPVALKSDSFMNAVFIITLFIGIHSLRAQLCTGSPGDPAVNIDFGIGANPGPALLPGQTAYEYAQEMCPGTGAVQHIILKS
jgi:hypothetical protein